MTPAQPLPPSGDPLRQPVLGALPAAAATGAPPGPDRIPGLVPGLVPAGPPAEEDEAMTLSTAVARLPVELDVVVPVRKFRVRNLLALEPGHVIESQWGNGEDVPLTSGNVQLAWSEFEVVDTQLAVRVTRLA